VEASTVFSAGIVERRFYLEFGFKSCKTFRKRCLSQAMKKKRLDFVKRLASSDIEMWK